MKAGVTERELTAKTGKKRGLLHVSCRVILGAS